MKKYRVLLIILLVAALLLGTGVCIVNQGNYEEMTGWKRTAYAILNKNKIINTDYIGKVSEETWSPEDSYLLEDTIVLTKEPGKDFVVMNLTDLHIGDYYYDTPFALREFEAIRRMAELYQPDLITISGDTFWTESAVYTAHWVSEFMDSLEIPWAPIFGNHDDDGNCDLNYLADVMMDSEYCLFRKGAPELGVGNYVINICQEADGKQEVMHSILMMDSHDASIWENQIDWYKWATAGVNEINGSPVESTVIFHIPIAQYVYAYEEAWDEENGCWKEGYDAFGLKKEIQCPEMDENGEPIDNGFFAAMKEIGTTKNTLCGHDHINDYSIVYDGIRLTYSKRLGISGAYDVDNMGATLITINDEGCASVRHVTRYDEE